MEPRKPGSYFQSAFGVNEQEERPAFLLFAIKTLLLRNNLLRILPELRHCSY